MKNILITLVALISIQAFSEEVLTFSDENTQVNGAITKLVLLPSIKSNIIHYTDIKVTEESITRSNISIVDRVVLEKKNLICRTFFNKRSRNIDSIICRKDDRAVGGSLASLSIVRNNTGAFDVSWSTFGGRGNIDKTEDLAFDLTLQ